MLTEVFGLLKAELPTPPSEEAMIMAAIRGMVRETDPEGAFFTEAEMKAMRAPADEKDGHPGLMLGRHGQQLVVAAALPGGPADAAGLRSGDAIDAIDGTSVAGLHPEQATKLLRGPTGSKVVLDLRRADSPTPVRREIERRFVPDLPPKLQRPTPDLVVMVVSKLESRTLEQAAATLTQEWRRRPFKGLVLDLRHSSGGLFSTSIGLAAMFVPADTVIATSVGAAPDSNRVFRAIAGDYASKGAARDPLSSLTPEIRALPLVVLVGPGTAAGAEIAVAALKDHQRATIVGQRTYGRGSIQTIRPLSGGGAVKLTTAHWESPSGTRIHGIGVEPHETLEDTDPQRQLDAAIASLQRRL